MDVAISIGLAMLLLMGVMGVATLFVLWSGNGGWTDTFWTFGVGLSGLLIAWRAGLYEGASRPALAGMLIGLWSLRLGLHLARRTVGRPEDGRYAALRVEWGEAYARQLARFLQIQAVAGLPLFIGIAIAAYRPGEGLDLFDGLAALLVLSGLFGTALADLQLERFKKMAPHRRVCDVGLWSRSRHPNYFFEWLCWCGWPVMALGAGLSYPQGLLAIAAPAVMYYLLRYVSGVPLLEAHMERSRPEAFAAYKARVPEFFPKVFG